MRLLQIEGNAVVDLWGGHANKARTRSWECDTIVNVWSACKAWSAVCVLILVDQGKIDVKQPIAKYWPEFGANGKDEVTVEQALSHQAAVVTYRKYLGRADETTWEQLTMELANESLFWELGTETRYHAFTFGVRPQPLTPPSPSITTTHAHSQNLSHASDLNLVYAPAGVAWAACRC